MSRLHSAMAALAVVGLFFSCSDDEPAAPKNPGPAGPSSVTLAPDKDNTLYEDAAGASSNGAGQFFFAGKTTGTGSPPARLRRAVLSFDVAGSAIPAGATIDSVRLSLRMNKSQPGTFAVSIHHVNADWGEAGSTPPSPEGNGTAAQTGDATWLHRFFDTTLWTSAGGDFDAGAAASATVGGVGTYTWSSAAMASHVQDWLDTPANNFGWILVGDESSDGSAKRFHSRENADTKNRPQLTVFYTEP